MWKHRLPGFAAALAAWLCLAPAAGAGDAPQQAPETKRIGVVFIQQVFKNYNYARDTEERIKAAFQPEQNRIEGEIARVQDLERSLQNNPLKPQGSPQWRKAMMEIESLKVEIQTMQEEFGKQVRAEEAAFWVSMYNAFQRACKVLAEYYKYDIVIAAPDAAISEDAVKAQDPMAIQQEILMRRVQYVSNQADLTAAITELLNQRYAKYQQDPQKNPL